MAGCHVPMVGMKILLVHNFYGSSAPSGENTVFAAEKKLLEEHGHEVSEYTRHSDEIRSQGVWGTLKGALSTPWNPFSRVKIRCIIEREKPDVMHVHNIFPLLSPAIFHSARSSATATVLTLHNYRTLCASGIPMRQGNSCTECIDLRSALPAMRFGCYRQSRLSTWPLTAMIALHRKLGTWQKHVDAFIALTEFQKGLLVQGGLPLDRIHVKPHFYLNPPLPQTWNIRGKRVIFIGRLSEEKGVEHLLEAWKNWPGQEAPYLDIIGDGPLREKLQSMVQNTGLDKKINFSGQLTFAETQRQLAHSRLLILPSIWFEGFPMVIREAFSLGVPVAASNLGSMPCIVNNGEDGVLFAPGDSKDLLQKVSALWKDQEKLATMAENARKEFESKYTSEANYKILMGIYQKAIEHRKQQIANR